MRRGKEHSVPDAGDDEGQARVAALGQKRPGLVDHHPPAVVAETELVHLRLVERQTPRRLDRIDVETGEPEDHSLEPLFRISRQQVAYLYSRLVG
jgi:hypothetical protein